MAINNYVNIQLNELIDNLTEMTTDVVGNERVELPDLRSVLRFINNIVQVVGDTFEDVYMVLLDVSLIDPKNVGSYRINDLRVSIRGLLARSRYRDAEEICSRLHHLSEKYDETIHYIIDDTSSRQRWRQVFHVLDAHEGSIINMVSGTVHELDSSLENATELDLPAVIESAERRAQEMRMALIRLQNLRNVILGLSGNQGLMELTSRIDRDKMASLTIEELRMGNVNKFGNVGSGAVVSVAQGKGISQTLQQAGVNQDELKHAFDDVFTAIRADQSLDNDDKEVALEIAGEVLNATEKASEDPSALKRSLTKARKLLGGAWSKMVEAMNSAAVQKTIGTITEASVQASIKSIISP
ncbi:hypothetical protein ACFYE2_14865 [Kocuria sp. CPCC 205300]|uniref:hypothetical protein n=1 Tax=Kocuria sabuli TaxID=3071448 RepID=UPI0036DBED97